jgi:hypothetical protein
MKRLGICFLVIWISYAFFLPWMLGSIGGRRDARTMDDGDQSGRHCGRMMCLRVLVLVMASVWVQASDSRGDVVRALERFGVPKFIAA